MKNNNKQSTSNTRITNLRVRITTQKMIKLFIATILFCGYNFTVFAETLTVRTITEALNYSGNVNTITKLVITDSIAGNDYSVASEWSKFRTLDETFPNIEAIEILTDQDIPDSYYPELARVVGLFYDSKVYHLPPNWLKHFSAPNVKKIGKHAFMRCGGLVSINFPNAIIISDLAFQYSTLESADFPNVTTIGVNAFIMCSCLKNVNLPVVTKIEFAFFDCPMLTSVSFGTGFTEPTTIDFGINVFGSASPFPLNGTSTLNIDLTLGEYVLPEPDLENKIWQSDNNDWVDEVWGEVHYALDYIWKSITVKEIVITTVSLPSGRVGKEYSEQLSAVSTTPITWSIDGNIPSGLSFSSSGLISGIPTEAGTFNFTVKAENASGEDTKELSITIENEVGIVEILTAQIKIYPNPTSGELKVTNNELGMRNIQIFDSKGEMQRMESKKTIGEITLDISDLPSGLYFLKIETEKGMITQKVIKK